MAGSSKFQVTAEIRATDAGASAAANRVSGAFGKLGNEIRSRLVVTAGDLVTSVRTIVGVFGDMFSAAAEAERGQTTLAQALERQGAATTTVIGALNAQAGAIASVTALTDDQITSTQTLLAQIGVSADKIPQATQAAVDLAAALGIDLETAARQVGATVNGVTGRLAQVAPELAGLSEEALRAGEGIRILGERFAGAGQAASADFGTQLQGLRNDIGELGEAFAVGVTGASNFDGAVRTLRTAFQEAGPAVETFGTIVAGVLGGFQTLGEAIGNTAGFFAVFGSTLVETGNPLTAFNLALETARATVAASGEAGAVTAGVFGNVGAKAGEAAPKVDALGAASADAAAKIASTVPAVAAATTAIDELNGSQFETVTASEAATVAFDAQTAAVGRLAASAGAAGVAIGRLGTAQGGLNGLSGTAAGISRTEALVLENSLFGGGLGGTGLSLGGGSTSLGLGGVRTRTRIVRTRPDGRRVLE